MGVSRAFELVDRHYSPQAVDPLIVLEQKHLDMNSMYLGYIQNTLRNMQLKNWRKPPADRVSVDDMAERVAGLLDKKLEKHFPRESTTLHFDGAYTTEKESEHRDRRENYQQLVQQVEAKIERTLEVIDEVPAPGVPTSSKRTKIVTCSKQATAAWRKARPWALEPTAKETLVRVLQGLGWDVHICTGEADTCISQLGDATVAVSADSDYLFRDVVTLIRKDPRQHDKFMMYDVPDMLSVLGISSNVWKAVGITSGNDYAANLDGIAIMSNFELMSLQGFPPDTSVSEILDFYCEAYATDKLQPSKIREGFLDAESVIGINLETFPLEQTEMRTSEIDPQLESMLDAVHKTVKAYWDDRRRKRVLASQVPAPMSDQDPMSLGCMSTSTADPAPNTLSNQPPKKRRRGYKNYMPGNRFTPHVYNQQGTRKTRSKSRRKRGKKKQKKRKRRTLYNPCSRKARMDPTLEKTETKRTNQLQPATVVKNCLKQYATVSLNCGTIATQLRKGLASNEVGDADDRGQIKKEVATVVKEMVRIGTEGTICVQQAISLYIARTMAEFSSLSKDDIAARKERLQHIGYFHNDQFFGNLLQDFFMWHDSGPRPGKARKDTAANTCIKDIVDMYRDFLTQSGGEVLKLQTTIQSHLTPFLQLAGRGIADTLQSHFQKNISELVERLKENNEDWAQGEEGKKVLATIDNKGKSTVHDPISLFWILNINLPVKNQFAFIPEYGFKDQFFTFTEESLLEALLHGHNQRCLDVFGPAKGAKEHAAQHRGDLIYRLFFSKSLSYDSRISLIHPDTNIRPGHSLLEFDVESGGEGNDEDDGSSDGSDDGGDDEKDEGGKNDPGQDSTMGSTSNKSSNTGSTSKDFGSGSKEDVKVLFQDVVRAAQDGCVKRKYVLTGSFASNGYELHVNASNLLRKAPKPSAKKPNTTRSKLQDVLTIDTREDHTVVVGIDPGMKKTATCCILNTETPHQAINLSISRGAYVHPGKTFQKELEAAKAKRHIHELERKIVPIQGELPWIQLANSIEGHIASKLLVHSDLRDFYSSDIFKSKSFNHSQALTATKNKAVDCVIAATGWQEDGALRPCFVIGDGQFGTQNNTSHQGFVDTLKKKVITT